MTTSAKFIRVITTPPIAAFVLLTLIFILSPASLSGTAHYIFALIFYTLLPILPYAFTRTVPRLKKGGRKIERKAAIIFSVTGYVLAVIYYAVFSGSRTEWVICLTYLISGVVIALCSALHFKASGHTCGIAGPVCCLAFVLGPVWCVGFAVLIPVIWASLKTKRHTLSQLIAGSFIPVAINCALWLLIK